MHKKTVDRSKDRQRHHWRRLLGVSVLCLGATAVTLNSVAQEPRGRWHKRFDMETSDDSVTIGKRGRDRQSFGLQYQRSQQRLGLKLKRQRQGATPERDIQFDYDAAQRRILVTVDGRPLQIAINPPGKTVRVGATHCQFEDYGCVKQAVDGALQDVTAEEFAALAIALRRDIDLPDGGGIQKVLRLLIDQHAPEEADL